MGEKQPTRCVDTIDIEELLEWMLRYPESHPDNGLLYDTTRADEPPVTPRPWPEKEETNG